MSNRDTLRRILERGTDTETTIAALIDFFPALEDHDGVRGYWTTSDNHGNMDDGRWATEAEALENGQGQWAVFVETDEDED